MAAPIVIHTDRLGKRYLIAHERGQERYTALRDVMAGAATRAWARMRGRTRGQQSAGRTTEEFWALKNVSIDIRQGEVTGVIGRNGAGKSTLLKILSRITEPTEGRVEIRGRVASLLEVGTGFHPELSGRENIFLNGAILGMSRREITAKFDEIVAYAEVERFLDTPDKRYSTGMYVRLAFAVAAHLEPEILIVDEVLAVGDSEFQKKCLGKMQDVAHAGRTVLVVSHNMPMVRNLCTRALVLAQGSITFQGNVDESVQHYLADSGGERHALTERADRRGDGRLRFSDAYVQGDARHVVRMGAAASIVLSYTAVERIKACNFSIHIENSWGQIILRLATRESGAPVSIAPGRGTIACEIPLLQLLPGRYTLLIAASVPPAYEYLDHIERAASFEVLEDDVYGTGNIPQFGEFFSRCAWHQSATPLDAAVEDTIAAAR